MIAMISLPHLFQNFMTKLPKNIFMLGIGGIGMSALAQYYQGAGSRVTGKDRTLSPVTKLLQEKGIEVRKDTGDTEQMEEFNLLIYSDAIPEEHPSRVQARASGIPELSYFEALGEITKGTKTIAVAGTHGKTTTTAMLTKLLCDHYRCPTSIIGSIVKDFGSNFVAGDDELFVVEACEYRDHLLKLAPDILVITNIEWDHSDWFPDLKAVQQTFKKAIENLPSGGILITDPTNINIAPLVVARDDLTVVDYTLEPIGEIDLVGAFNRKNAQAAKATARCYQPNLSTSDIDKSLQQFQGSWRRFEYKGVTKNGALVYDDYAHHPTAIRATLSAVRERFPDKELVVLFHPHLYSRTQSHFAEFAESLSLADQLFLLPIYPAREQATDYPGVTTEALVQAVVQLTGQGKVIKTKEQAVEVLTHCAANSLILTLGAGEGNVVADLLITQ